MFARRHLVGALAVALGALGAADPEVQRGVSLFEHLDYDRAVVVLGRALVRPELSREDRIEGLAALSFAYTTLDDRVHAEETLHRLLDVDPSYEVPGSYSPRFRDAFAEAKATWEAGRQVRFDPEPDPERLSGYLGGDPRRIGSVVLLGEHGEIGSLACSQHRCRGERPEQRFFVEVRDHRGVVLGRFGPFEPRPKPSPVPWWAWVAIGAGAVGVGALTIVLAQPRAPPQGGLGTLQLP